MPRLYRLRFVLRSSDGIQVIPPTAPRPAPRRKSSLKICALSSILALALLSAAAQQPAKPTPEAAAQQIVHQLVAGQFSKIEAQFDPTMAGALEPGKLAAGWSKLLPQFGPFESITEAKAHRVQGLDVVVVVCKFHNSVVDAVIAFDPDGKIAGLNLRPHQEPPPPWTPPVYAKPDSFSERPMTLVNGKFELPGTLTLPKGGAPFTAVILVHGSGANDQDETAGATKPFKDLAWGLATRGIAVFRYTKRTRKYGGESSDDPASFTVDDETISDARAAVLRLVHTTDISPDRVFLLGHSLGGYLAPRIATGDPQISGIVIFAGNTRPIEQLVLEQVRYMASADGAPGEENQKLIAAAEEAAQKIESPSLKPGDSIPFLGSKTNGAYWLDLRNYDPVHTALQLKIPILIMQGGRDYQVTPTDFNAWKMALEGHANATLKFYPDLNHLFVSGSGPSTPQEYERPGHVSESVVADIAAWLTSAGKGPTQ
jgi:dienelactone hydrolase